MPGDLAGKRVLVTGGSRGIGREIVLTLARAGGSVVTCYLEPGDAPDSLASTLKETGGSHRVIQADVTTAAGAATLARECEEALGGLDVVVNNVGADFRAKFDELELSQWHEAVGTNLTSSFLVTQAALPLVADNGSIINVGAAAAQRGRPHSAHYAAAKSALSGLTRSLAREVGRRGIRVNLIAPGVIEKEPDAGLPPEVASQIRGMTALGRFGTCEDVAAAVLFLASDMSRYITGATLNIDGGI
jgi:3-oxoacyl-[acyl-carrier protein] reductase